MKMRFRIGKMGLIFFKGCRATGPTDIDISFTHNDASFTKIDARFTPIDKCFTEIDINFTDIAIHSTFIDITSASGGCYSAAIISFFINCWRRYIMEAM